MSFLRKVSTSIRAKNLAHFKQIRLFNTNGQQSPQIKTAIISGVIGTICCGGIVVGGIKYFQDFKQFKKQQEYNEARNFMKFMDNHHIPNPKIHYKLERMHIVNALKNHIIVGARVKRVYNIVASKSIGKSIMLKEAARAIDKMPGYKVFYIDCDASFRQYLSEEYDLVYKTDREAVIDFIRHVKRYRTTKGQDKNIILIIDSPGGISDAKYRVVRSLKGIVADGYATVYCVTSPSNQLFTEDRIAILGEARYKEINQDEWINFSLDEKECDVLFNKYEKELGYQFTKKQKEQVMSKKENIGHFIAEMSNIDQYKQRASFNKL